MAHTLVEAHSDLAATLDLVDKWIQKRVFDTHQPGLAVAVVQGGELLWGKAYGVADIASDTAVALDTRFRIASITKTFIAVAMLQLREQDKVRFDEPVSSYLDWFTLRYSGAPPITLYHLLTHTSGLPRDATVPHWTEDRFQSWKEVVATTKQRELVAAPLERFGYSNLGYALLGGVIESVSGQSWADYLQTRILDPLGMNNTVVMPKGDEAGLATGYLRYGDSYERAPAPFVETGGFSASASFASSINDLVKYAGFHLSEGRSGEGLSSYSLHDMHRPHWLHDDWQSGYGLGSGILRLHDVTVAGHSGGYKGYLTAFTVCREHNIGVIVLTNSVSSDPFQYVRHIYKWLLPEVLKATAKDKPEADPAWRRYLGVYKNDWGESVVVIRHGQLQVIAMDTMDMPPTVLEATDKPHTFKLKQPGNPVESARFELDAEGKVWRLWYGNEYSLRQGE